MKIMRTVNLLIAVACVGLIATGVSHQLSRGNQWGGRNAESISASSEAGVVKGTPQSATQRYRLDASQSKFIAHALAGGLLWFKGHDHLVGVRDFTGEAQLTPDSVTPASLQIDAKSASMIETSSVFAEQQKQIINKELREIVL